MTKLLKLSIYSVISVFVVLILWLTVGGMIAEGKLDEAVARWEKENGSIASFHERHPRVEKNDAARKLEELASAVGVNIRPRSEGEVIPSDHPIVVETKNQLTGIGEFLQTQAEKTSGPLDPVPAPIASYIRKHRSQLLAIEEQLTTGPVPSWPYEGAIRPETEVPNLLGHMQLARLTNAHALLALEDKSHDEAWKALHATSKLSEALQPHPLMISQLIATAISKHELLLARHFPAPAPPWQLAAPRRDRRRDFLDAVAAEQMFVDAAARGATLLGAARGANPPRLVQLLTQPFSVACAANLWDYSRLLLADLKRADYCAVDPATFGMQHHASIARWNIIGNIAAPNAGSGIVRVRDRELTEEMTRKVLEAKGAKLASGGVWPQKIEKIGECRCKTKSWKYGVDASGTMTLALNGTLPVERNAPTKLPLSYSAR